MSDDDLVARIHALASEEHRLQETHSGDGLSDEDHARFRELERTLDQLWDLLRQRRALRDAGRDPDGAAARPEGTVEGYLQ